LCQGGWMSLAYAARFPHKVRRLVLVGAPIDIAAGESMVSQSATKVPLLAFEQLVRLNGGRVRGQRALQFWESPLGANDARRLLQLPDDDSATVEELSARFTDWYRLTVDLPGTYYLEVVSWLFKENRLANGEFVALGRRIDLASVHQPVFLLGARDDTLVALDQLFATANRIGTIKRSWARIAAWLSEEISRS
jgi:poly(3-hydroxyalkanoate) synthetase